MKKYIRKIVGFLAISTMLFGCGSQTTKQQDKDVVNDVVESDDQNQDIKEGTSDKSDSDSDNDLDIKLPNEEELIADYTSVKGLVMEPGSHIAVVVKNTELGYWKAVEAGMQQAIDELNEELGYKGSDKIYMTFESPKIDNSVDGQVNILDSVVSENPDVICLSAIDMNSCIAQIEAANQNGIPVIILDSGLEEEDLVYSNCSTDNYSAGKEAAKRLCENIGEEGQVAVLAHIQLSETSVSRLGGFLDEIKENHPNVEVVNISFETSDDLSLLKEQMQAVLTLYPELKGYFCTNQVVSEVALEVLENKKYEDTEIALVGFDLGEKQLEAIRSGKQVGSICQNPYGMGYATVVAGVRAVIGMSNDKFIDAGFQWLDQATVDLEENARYLYE